MRRALVMTDETARHPFLASLPPHIRRGTVPVRGRKNRFNAQDLIDFLTAYCACFVGTLVFFS